MYTPTKWVSGKNQSVERNMEAGYVLHKTGLQESKGKNKNHTCWVLCSTRTPQKITKFFGLRVSASVISSGVLVEQRISLDVFFGIEYESKYKIIYFSKMLLIFSFAKCPPFSSCFLAATKQLYEWYFLSVCPSHLFHYIFPSSYHHETFRAYYQWPTWSPSKRSRSEAKSQGHRGQNPT